MIRIIQDNITQAFYMSCPHCNTEIEFWEVMPPVMCDMCYEVLIWNPMSLVEDVESRAEYFSDRLENGA